MLLYSFHRFGVYCVKSPWIIYLDYYLYYQCFKQDASCLNLSLE